MTPSPHRDSAVGSVTTLLRVGSTATHRPNAAAERLRSVRVETAMKPVPNGIEPTASLEEAEERMDAAGVNWLPVVESGRTVGLITRLDIRQAVTTAAPAGRRPRPR